MRHRLDLETDLAQWEIKGEPKVKGRPLHPPLTFACLSLPLPLTTAPSILHSLTIQSTLPSTTMFRPMSFDLTTSNTTSPTVVDLTTDDDTSPITNQELQQVLHRFPLNPKPARLSPDVHGFAAPAKLLDAAQLSMGFDPTPDPDNTRSYHILHPEEGWVCNLQPLMQTKVAGLLTALPDSEGTSPEPHPIRPQLGSPSTMEEDGGGVEGGAVETGCMENEGEEAAAAQTTGRAHPGDPGLATEDEGVDLFDPEHPFITYSHFPSARGGHPVRL